MESKSARAAEGCLEWTGAVGPDGYGRVWHQSRMYLAHRAAWELVNGAIPVGKTIDHVCFNRRCIDVAHLRLADAFLQNQHRQGALRTSTTGIRGVFPQRGKFQVRVWANGSVHEGGYFTNLEDARAKAEQMREVLHRK